MNELFHRPVQEFVNVLEKHGSLEKMYSAIKTDDLADAVMTALDILNEAKLMVKISKTNKSQESSCAYLRLGNNAFDEESYEKALNLFNLAILSAPPNSISMIHAYNNRSTLLLKIKAISSCMKDIDRCMAMCRTQSMSCSKNIITELEEKKKLCAHLIREEDFRNMLFESKFGVDYFTLNVKRNKDIPCVSADVNTVKENGLVKVIAAKDIALGKVIAIEPAFVAVLDDENSFYSCHYCHQMNFNLIPCDGCCKVLFCDEECKKQCLKEYHKIECQIINVIDDVSSSAKCKLPIVAALKMREMSNSWQDLITDSLKSGKNEIEESSISELCNMENMKSILYFNNDVHFLYGKIFNQCFLYAVIIKHLSDIPDYLPKDKKESMEAQRALARIMLSLFVKFPFQLDIQNCALNYRLHNVSSEPQPSTGLFSFASKLTHSCDPNLLCVGLGKKLALIAVKFIKKGTELTISYPGHWAEISYEGIRSVTLFFMLEMRCKCRVCVEDWTQFNVKPGNFSTEQTRCMRKWRCNMATRFPIKDEDLLFRETCRTLKMFQDSPHTLEYITLFKHLRTRLTHFQYASTRNDTV